MSLWALNILSVVKEDISKSPRPDSEEFRFILSSKVHVRISISVLNCLLVALLSSAIHRLLRAHEYKFPVALVCILALLAVVPPRSADAIL